MSGFECGFVPLQEVLGVNRRLVSHLRADNEAKLRWSLFKSRGGSRELYESGVALSYFKLLMWDSTLSYSWSKPLTFCSDTMASMFNSISMCLE